MSDNEASDSSTRRSFLDVLLGLSLLAWLLSILYPVLRYLTPLPREGPVGPARLTRDELVKLERQHFVIVPASGKRIVVLENPAHELVALDARCTHEGCTVQYLPGEAIVWCACHNGRFNLDGRVLSGPPPRPLARYGVEREADGAVVIFPERRLNA